MKSYSVEITDNALSDMDDIYRHIRDVLQAPGSAAAQYDRIADEILKLEIIPERYRIPPIPFLQRLGLHRMLVDNYSVFYLVKENRVIVTDVLYSASDFLERLGERY